MVLLAEDIPEILSILSISLTEHIVGWQVESQELAQNSLPSLGVTGVTDSARPRLSTGFHLPASVAAVDPS